MQQKVIIGIIGLISSGMIYAENAVVIYGVVDAGISVETKGLKLANNHKSIYKLDSGIREESRFGIRGQEIIHPNLSALFRIEAGFHADDGTLKTQNNAYLRQAYVGLSGSLGTLTAGKQNSVYDNIVTAADPFHNGLAGRAYNLVGAAGNAASGGYMRRINHAVQYTSPNLYGLTLTAQYGFGEQPGKPKQGRNLGLALHYQYDALSLYIGYQYNRNVPAIVWPLNPIYHSFAHDAKLTLIGITYDVGPFILHGLYSQNRRPTTYGALYGFPRLDSTDYLIGMTLPVGRHTFKGSVIKKVDKVNVTSYALQMALGYEYAFSHRTTMYASMGMIKHFHRVVKQYNKGFTVGNASNDGTGTQGFNIGISHTF